METKQSINSWQVITKQLLIRSIECILEARFPEMAASLDSVDSPMNYPFRKNFSGKFGLKRDLKSFPDFNKTSKTNYLQLSFNISPLSSKVSPRGESQKKCDSQKDLKTIETWNISLLINENYIDDDQSLINCYSKILTTIHSKVAKLPLGEFVNTTGKRLGELQHILNYQLKPDFVPSSDTVENLSSGCGIAAVESRTKSTEFKFNIGFGYINFEVEYISLKSLARINRYLAKGFDPAYSRVGESTLDRDYPNECSNSPPSSKDFKEDKFVTLDESDDFVLITTSDNNIDIKADESKYQNSRQNEESKISPSGKTRERGDEDNYEFGGDILFKNKNPPLYNPHEGPLKNEGQLRKRINSDTTACSRVRNMLSKLKLFEKDKKPEIFERKQFEFKNIVSPTYIENLVIDEGYFGIKEESTKKEKTIHDDFEDEDFNPFRESARKMSDALVSPNSNQGPTFRGLREFRTSLDGNDPITKNEFGDRDDQMENKHRKFTLSFKENDKKFQGVDESFVKLEEGSSIPFKLDKFKNKETIIKDQEDYSINAECGDEFDAIDLADFIPHIDKSLQNTADTQGYDMGDDENIHRLKLKHTKSREEIAELESSNFESILLSLGQAITDSTFNSLNTSDDYCLFLNNMETLRRRIDSTDTDVSEEIFSPPQLHQSLSRSITYNSEMREILLNNYMEIVELKEKINESTFDSILN